MAERITRQSEDEFVGKRMKQVKNYESYLYENSYRVVKVFLHVSKQEQKKRFLERIDRKEKNWKFNADDLTDRKLFDTFMKAFEDTIDQTATKESPWYAIPADDKWYTRYLLSEILIDVIEKTKPEYPELPGDQRERLQTCREELVAENGGRGPAPKCSAPPLFFALDGSSMPRYHTESPVRAGKVPKSAGSSALPFLAPCKVVYNVVLKLRVLPSATRRHQTRSKRNLS